MTDKIGRHVTKQTGKGMGYKVKRAPIISKSEPFLVR